MGPLVARGQITSGRCCQVAQAANATPPTRQVKNIPRKQTAWQCRTSVIQENKATWKEN